jgi:signal transduction histidine kinase
MPTEPTPPPEPVRDLSAGQDDKLILAMEVERSDVERRKTPWKVLVVDDEEEVHTVTQLALDDFHFDGRRLQLLNAFSGAEARHILKANPDIALILLDVVMESDDAGLAVARFVRQELGNHFVRIVLRTGQPGMAPERTVLTEYDVNDYRTKTELTQSRMFSVVYTALSSYRVLLDLASSHHRLAHLVVELERSNHELEQFAYIASHDLQTPLRGITSFSQLLQQKYEGILDAQGREYLDFITDSAAQMRGLIEALLTLSRVGSGGTRLAKLDLNELVAIVTGWLKPLIDERQVVLEVSDLPVLRADKTMLIQLMQNLISNAIKFQERNPPHVRIFARRGAAEWIIGVKDQGIGIKPEHYKRIFQIFQRLHTNDKYEGSGIGLAVCEKIVHLHGGKIWVESEPGKGCTFFFSIPDPREVSQTAAR